RNVSNSPTVAARLGRPKKQKTTATQRLLAEGATNHRTTEDRNRRLENGPLSHTRKLICQRQKRTTQRRSKRMTVERPSHQIRAAPVRKRFWSEYASRTPA